MLRSSCDPSSERIGCNGHWASKDRRHIELISELHASRSHGAPEQTSSRNKLKEMNDMTIDNIMATTNDAGIPVPSDEHSLTVGPDGPILLQDHYLIEQMANFNRERVPERQPHAKGGGAFGHFEVLADVSRYTKAALFQPKTTTDTLTRFST
jgi:hypothetical protein